jgi:glutathione S-transferase
MKLYYMPGACSLATHILLAETGAKYELERVGRDKKTEHGADFLALNPKGYVPALQLDDGEIVTENVAIHSFIADSHPGSHLLPANGTRERLRANELMVFISTEIHKGYSPLFSPTLPDEVKAGYRDKLATRYALIEKQLADGRTWLTGETYTTADAYLFTVSNWAKPLNVDLSKFTGVQAWLGRVAARPAVQTALKAEGLA